MNYISSSASAVKHLEERKEKKKTDLISRKRKFQCLNMQLIPGAAKENSSFSSLSKKQHLVSLRSTVLVYYTSFRNKICIRPGHIIHKVREGRKKSKKENCLPSQVKFTVVGSEPHGTRARAHLSSVEVLPVPWAPVGAHVTAPSIS